MSKSDEIWEWVIGLPIMVYLSVGVLHGWWLGATVGKAACFAAESGFLYWYCHVGNDWAWGIAVFAWPLYWV
jgi:hypothetical protein